MGTYYLKTPGGYFRIVDCPSPAAAHDLATRLFGHEAVTDWELLDEPPTGTGGGCWCEISWLVAAPDAWLESDGWRQLLEVLSDSRDPYSDLDLRADLTRGMELARGAVCRIAADELRAAEARIRNAAGPFEAEDLAAMHEHPAAFLEGLAKAIEGPR